MNTQRRSWMVGPAASCFQPDPYLVLVVSVVVVVTGPGTVVCSDVVVVLLVVVGAVQAESETRTSARQGRISFFICLNDW